MRPELLGGRPTERLRILHSHPVWLPLTQTWMHNQIRFLPDEFESHVVCDTRSNVEIFPVDDIHSADDLPLGLRQLEMMARKTRLTPRWTYPYSVAQNLRPKVVHSHFGHNGWVDMPFVKAMGALHVVTFYGGDLDLLPRTKPWWKRRFRSLFQHVDLVLCEGPFMAARIRGMGCAGEKIRVHHLGVDLSHLPFEPLEWAQGTRLRVLLAASFREKKGIPYALAALKRLGDDVPIEVTIVGDAGSDEASKREKKKILTLAGKMSERVKVSMPGYLAPAELLRLARKHHVFMQPSLEASDGDTEGGAPVAILEMAAMGLLIVASTHCDIPELLPPSAHHLLAEERSIDGLVDALRWLVNNPSHWHRLRTDCRSRVEAEFDAVHQGELLGRLYRHLAQSAASAVAVS